MYGPMSRNARNYGYNPIPFQSNKSLIAGIRQQQTNAFIPGVNGPQPLNWDPYLIAHTSQNPYFVQPAQPPVQGYQQMPIHQQHSNSSYAQAVFQNPLMPPQKPYAQNQQMNSSSPGFPYMNPYPKGSFLAKSPTGMKSVLNSFKSQDGSIDINKMVDTAGQVVNAVSQVSSVVKGFGGMFKV